MESKAVIGTNIKTYREKLHYTQENIATFLGVPRETISYYENGHREIDLDKLEKLANLFNIELEDLLSENISTSCFDIAIAFRSEELVESDLITISQFQKIVRNFLKMQKILAKNAD